MTSTRLGCAVLGLLAAAACSSSTSGKGSTDSTASSSSPSSTVTSAAPPSSSSGAPSSSAPSGLSTPPGSASSAILPSLVLKTSDVPSGWTPKPHVDDPTSDTETADVIACLGSNLQPNAGRIRQVHSDDFDMGQSEITSDASSWQTEQNVQDQIALITDPRAGDCFKQAFQKQLSSTPGLQVTVDIRPGAGGFPSDVAARLHALVSYTSSGKTVQLFFDTAFIAKGTVTAEVDFFGFGEQIPPAVSSGMVQAVANRVASL